MCIRDRSVEVYKYPYCGKLGDTENYLSNKICCYTIRTCKKIIKKAKWLIVYGDLILRLSDGIIGLPTSPQISVIALSMNSNAGLSKEYRIDRVMKRMTAEMDFTEKEIDQLYNLAIECKNNSLNKEQLIKKINDLRDGSFIDTETAFDIVGFIVMLLTNDWGLAFRNDTDIIVRPYLQ